ncbi:MAG: methylmalonyl-CoA mutase, partial [Candidatus Electrothrix sp. ATG2]|nr:methylmalonyl-CoA mutase [Candidatus Electrothrix sp. ATG2]
CGGVVACIENGFIAGQIEDAAYQYQQEIESRDRVIVGVNEFQVDEEAEVPVMRVDPAVEDEQVRSLAQVKAERDQEAVRQCLTDLEAAARSGSENLMEPVLAAVRCYCSLGEICDVLRRVFGEYRGRAW